MFKGNLSKRQEQQILKADLKRKTHFQENEIDKLLYKFIEICKKGNTRVIIRPQFRDLLHNSFCMTDDMLLDRVFKAFDKDADGCINQKEWIEGLSVFLKGNIHDQVQFTFDVYDLNSDGYISREEVFQLLKKTISKTPNDEDAEENIKELVELVMKKMDRDHDGRLSKTDFYESVNEDNLLIEALGPCLPSFQSRDAFLATLVDSYQHH